MGRTLRWFWIAPIFALAALALAANARNWGSVDFELTAEGMAAADKVKSICGQIHTYQRLRDGDLLTDAESFAVHEDSYEGEGAFRIESSHHDDEVGGLVTSEVVLDGLTLRPLVSRRHAQGAVQETVYSKGNVAIASGAAVPRTIETEGDTLDFLSLRLLFLKFIDDTDRIRFSFLFDGVLYHFHASYKETETVVLGSSTYDTMHIVCKMRGTWAHLAPALHFWIEVAPPYRLVRYQARREVVELLE